MADFHRLGDLIGGAKPNRGSVQARLAEVWPLATGLEISLNSVPSSFRAGKLVVATSSSAWAQTLQFMSLQLVERLNAALGEPLVKEVVFRTAGWPGRMGTAGATAEAEGALQPGNGLSRNVPESRALSEEEEAAVREVEAAACDPVLGARLAGLMRAALSRGGGGPRT